jgi:hypothetical protein
MGSSLKEIVFKLHQARKVIFLIGLTKIGMSFLWRFWGLLMLMISRRNLID